MGFTQMIDRIIVWSIPRLRNF